MKKKAIIFALLVLFTLGGCSLPPPGAADGSPWDESWITVGNVIGVDTPEGLTPRENIDTLAANELYYATWSMGEGVTTGEGEEEITVYPAQVYLLLQGYETVEEAQDGTGEWLGLAKAQYTIDDIQDAAYNGQEFTVVTHTGDASAFGTYGNYAISVEISCQAGFDGDALAILSDFLEHCHYAA